MEHDEDVFQDFLDLYIKEDEINTISEDEINVMPKDKLVETCIYLRNLLLDKEDKINRLEDEINDLEDRIDRANNYISERESEIINIFRNHGIG